MSVEMTRKGVPDKRYTWVQCDRCRKVKRPNAFGYGITTCRKCRRKAADHIHDCLLILGDTPAVDRSPFPADLYPR